MPLTLSDAHRTDNVHDQLFVKVFAVARVTIGRTWNSADVCSGYWRLYQNDRAGASLLLAGAPAYPLAADRIHLVPAWVRFTCHNRRALEHRFVHFDLIGVTAVTVQHLFTKPLTLARSPHLEALARKLTATGTAPEVAICHAKAVVYAALGSVLAQMPTVSAALLTPPGPVSPAVRRIEETPGAPFTNRELAALCHLSEDHFGKVFRRQIGRTPAQYVIERRIAAATQALAFSNHSIEQIADQLGFANRFHLTRLFTRRMGLPPAAYRRQAHV